MARDHGIDAFRGSAIIGMVFFTVTLRLSGNLPDVFRHNVWGSLHLGDFILPMFLFASGLSLAYFLENNENGSQGTRNILVRFGTLALIGVSLSFFSAYGFFEMDEVLLSALLFLMCIVLYRLSWKMNLFIVFCINLSYLVLVYFDSTDIFIGHYLGGYPAALYYLPIMLIGLMIGKESIVRGIWSIQTKTMMVVVALNFFIFWSMIPINKLTATPSFMMLSVLFSFFFFVMIHTILRFVPTIDELEYLGKKPLRYWILMYLIFLIPLWFYTTFTSQTFPLSLHWPVGIIVSFMLLVFLWGISHLIDSLHYKKKVVTVH